MGCRVTHTIARRRRGGRTARRPALGGSTVRIRGGFGFGVYPGGHDSLGAIGKKNVSSGEVARPPVREHASGASLFTARRPSRGRLEIFNLQDFLLSCQDLPLLSTICTSSQGWVEDRKSTRLNSSHLAISYAVFC